MALLLTLDGIIEISIPMGQVEDMQTTIGPIGFCRVIHLKELMGEEEVLIGGKVLIEGELLLEGEVVLEGEVDLKGELLLGHAIHPQKTLQREKIMLKGILQPLLLGHPICLLDSKNAMHLRLSGTNV